VGVGLRSLEDGREMLRPGAGSKEDGPAVRPFPFAAGSGGTASTLIGSLFVPVMDSFSARELSMAGEGHPPYR
jgi:hypothetical protein